MGISLYPNKSISIHARYKQYTRFKAIQLAIMKFIIAVTALASLAQAAVINKRQDSTQNFEFQSFSAACEAGSDQCT